MSDRFRHLELGPREVDDTVAQHALAGTPVRGAATDLRLAADAARVGRFETALRLYTRALRDDRALIPAWVGQVQMLVELGEHAEARLWSDKALELFRNNGELLAAKAQACARLGDTGAAIACSDASLTSPGSSPARWQARGEVLLARRRGRARDCFERSFAEAGADWFDRVIVARIHLYYARATAALKYAQEAVALDPAEVYAWYVVGQCQEAMGWYDQAETSYERCRELSDEFGVAERALVALRSRTLTERAWGWLRGRLRR